IILRGRQQHLFSEFMTEHPTIDAEVLETAKSAYKAYLEKNLPLLDPELPPAKYQEEVEKVYAVVLNGGPLPGNEKPGDDEAKVKMHIKTVSSAAKAIAEAESSAEISSETFYTNAQDILLPYLDKLKGATINGDDHSIFTKLTKKYEERFMKDVRDLNVLDPDEITRVTEYGEEIAEFVQRIVENKFGWPSIWGKGRPGWHIECSAMASAKLGRRMDIHSGGIDLAFPHHDNELAQSEAYWAGSHDHDHGNEQWVNYFFHMGHLSIQGSKMSKSLKNFTTIREALERKDWTPRSLRIVFLLGGWREGIEITEELVSAGNAWEDKVNNFFLKMKDPSTFQTPTSATDDSLAAALEEAKDAVHKHLCDSFNTPGAMYAISELISKYNSADKSTLNPQHVEAVARWVTSMVNMFGLNGSATPDSPEIGWSGIDVPEVAKPYLYPLSAMRDSLRQLARSKDGLTAEKVKEIANSGPETEQEVPEEAKPYANVLSDFRTKLSSLEKSENIGKEVLSLCDRLRDVDLFDLGVYLEDRDNLPALVRPVTKELIQAREEKAARARQKQIEKENREKEALKKAEKGRISHLEMFRTAEFSAWDEDGIPTHDAAGEEISKSRAKKLRKDWEKQKKLHEAWLASNMGAK
ncbi:Cysteinyl-tRNA synthetase, partial [Rasamsonia emersonii CBS 393.64]